MSRRNAADVTTFARLMALRGDKSASVIDATDVMMPDAAGRLRRWPRALLPQRVITASGLADRARPISDEETKQAVGLWRKLESENAAVRVVADGRIRSAMDTYLDKGLLAGISERPRCVAHVLGAFLDAALDAEDAPSINELFLLTRFEALADQGIIRIDGAPTVRARCWRNA